MVGCENFSTRRGREYRLWVIRDNAPASLGVIAPDADGPPRAGDVPHSQADDSRIRALFPDIEPVPLAIGLKATVDWMRAVI